MFRFALQKTFSFFQVIRAAPDTILFLLHVQITQQPFTDEIIYSTKTVNLRKIQEEMLFKSDQQTLLFENIFNILLEDHISQAV